MFVLVPGAGGAGWYWHLLVAELERRGQAATAVDIREDDPALGLPEYADITRAAITGHPDVALAGFTVPMVAADTPLHSLVLVNAMIPVPGETPGQWWDATGQPAARAANDAANGWGPDFDEAVHFLHDVPPAVVAAGASEQRAPSDTPFGQPCEFERWPDVPIRVLAARGDRFFPASFQREVAKQRLGIDADEIDGGHLLALSNPTGLADYLLS